MNNKLTITTVMVLMSALLFTGCSSNSSTTSKINNKINTVETPTPEPIESIFDVIDNSFFGGFAKNSAGGIDVGFAFNYHGNKIINYVNLQYDLLNAVDDPAYDEIKHTSSYSARIIGPFNPNEAAVIILSAKDTGLYCSTLSKMNMKKIEFEYNDGSKASSEVNLSFEEDEDDKNFGNHICNSVIEKGWSLPELLQEYEKNYYEIKDILDKYD